MDSEDIYYGECYHIFCDDIRYSDCIKRYYEITPLQGKKKRIIICNEYLRLKVKENAFKWKECYRRYDPYKYTIQDIISEYIKVSNPFRGLPKKINPVFDYCICERPYITSEISLFEAVKLIIGMHEDFNYNDFNREFIERTYSHIHETARYFSKFCKYKRQSERIKVLTNHVYNYYYDSKNPQRLVELFLIFFEVQTYIESLQR